MKLRAKSTTYTAAGRVKAGDVFEVDDTAGQAMLDAGIASKAAQSAEVSAPAEAGPPSRAKKG